MQGGFTDTILLDCNRSHSEQAIGGDNETPALFTNKIGSGIKVSAGDKVSVYSSFISEIGAGADTIEYKGDTLDIEYITHTNVEYKYPINACNLKPLGWEQMNASNIVSEVQTYDNKTSIAVEYYKTCNGENHFHLPRRFCWATTFDTTNNGEQYVVEDEDDYGRIKIFNGGSYGNSFPYISASFNSSINNVLVHDKYYVKNDFFRYLTQGQGGNIIKKRTDGSKYKIYIRKQVKYGTQASGTNSRTFGMLSPAEDTYYEYIDKVDVEVNTGFSTPEMISEQITNELQESDEPELINYYSLNANIFPDNAEMPISIKQSSKVYKPFFSANKQINNQGNYTSWSTYSDYNEGYNDSLAYDSSYQFIGVKRPRLFNAIRDFANFFINHTDVLNDLLGKGGFQFLYDINASDYMGTTENGASNVIVTNVLWTKENLDAMKPFFDAQEIYPELFTNDDNHYRGYTNENNSRFLHLNYYNASYTAGSMNLKHSEYLGSDMLGLSASFGGASDVNFKAGFGTKPLFFDYNPEYKDVYSDGNSWESGYCYGWGRKWLQNDGSEYIALSVNHLGYASTDHTIPKDYFYYNNGSNQIGAFVGHNNIRKHTMVGADVHFSAYGTSCIGLWDGMSNQEFNNIGELRLYNASSTGTNATTGASFKVQLGGGLTYLGADAPTLNYNSTKGRFEWTQLHTSERVNNNNFAGGVTSAGLELEPIKANQGDKVYKINKRLYGNNWTPDMLSYLSNDFIKTATARNGSAVSYNWSLLNQNITPFSIIDSHSGIIIKDFGYKKDKWNDGIWGVLGFTYEQFNASETDKNDITSRIGELNNQKVAYAFTNADVNAGDSINYTSNIFGGNYYSNNLSYPHIIKTSSIVNESYFMKDRFLFSYPEVSQAQVSITLPAPNLPRKMLRPYYCIRSDIIDKPLVYIGGKLSGQSLPVVAIVNKINGDGDFFFQENEGVSHTFTSDKTITNITTSIHDPDQSYAKVDEDSAVIYKIQKQVNSDFNIVQQVMGKK